MKYQKSISSNVYLKQISISNLLVEREDVNDAFEKAIDYLRDHQIEIPSISSSIFFDKLTFKGGKTSSKFQRTKERMLGCCFHLNTPDEILEIIITSAFMSCQFKNTLVELILGNPNNFQVEIIFDEGKIRSYNSYKVKNNEFLKLEDSWLLKNDRNIFQCSETEMKEYFSQGVLKRLVKRN